MIPVGQGYTAAVKAAGNAGTNLTGGMIARSVAYEVGKDMAVGGVSAGAGYLGTSLGNELFGPEAGRWIGLGAGFLAGMGANYGIGRLNSIKNFSGLEPPKVPADLPSGLDDVVDTVKSPVAFRQSELASSYELRISKTPAQTNPNVQFEGARGESLCTLKPPPDPNLNVILDNAGVSGIEYRNGIPDFSPTASAEVKIDYMLGGTGSNGTVARNSNFKQADTVLANELNNSSELAQQFGFNVGEVTPANIAQYRKQNGLTWHELNDCTTMQLMPSKVNSSFTHLGGVGEINAGAFEPGGFAN